MFTKISLIALLSLRAYAQGARGNGNLTIAFFANDQQGSCDSNDTSDGLVLTTSSIPTGYTCFNLTDIFSQSNDTGFQNATSTVYDRNGEIIQPNGIDWLLQNRDSFDSKTNYSRVWYEQVNRTGDVEAGEEASWVFYIYAFPDCQQIADGDNVDQDDYPWFETSCQTDNGGQCQMVPYSIKSFAINSAADYNNRHGQCEEWAYKGAAS
ncbi:hypothetical protein AK830_g1309 [Neonectria ditissima]|uniref:Uncharacterized protein n=1 Tax=Neonectria ditissima TaxID=78410 RepID=A0A0P7B696_9HYPO|nr:hypothetical protein AK830_g1309 [Neonectria ditissima]